MRILAIGMAFVFMAAATAAWSAQGNIGDSGGIKGTTASDTGGIKGKSAVTPAPKARTQQKARGAGAPPPGAPCCNAPKN